LTRQGDGSFKGETCGRLVTATVLSDGSWEYQFSSFLAGSPVVDRAKLALVGESVGDGGAYFVPSSVEWVGFDVAAAIMAASVGFAVAFMLHMGCVMSSWFIGDFLDTVRFGLSR